MKLCCVIKKYISTCGRHAVQYNKLNFEQITPTFSFGGILICCDTWCQSSCCQSIKRGLGCCCSARNATLFPSHEGAFQAQEHLELGIEGMGIVPLKWGQYTKSTTRNTLPSWYIAQMNTAIMLPCWILYWPKCVGAIKWEKKKHSWNKHFLSTPLSLVIFVWPWLMSGLTAPTCLLWTHFASADSFGSFFCHVKANRTKWTMKQSTEPGVKTALKGKL